VHCEPRVHAARASKYGKKQLRAAKVGSALYQ
jgi:hypothetical protein